MTNLRLVIPSVGLVLALSMATGSHAVQKGKPTLTPGELVGEFVKVPPGEFQMGCLPEDRCDPTPRNVSQVRMATPVRPRPPVTERLERGFEIGKFEVTQAQWQRVMGKNPAPAGSIGPDFPVMSVSVNDVEKFLEKLNALKDGYQYRLPTAVEWEFAARAAGGAGAGNAWHAGNSGGQARRVGQLPANGLGLHDILGNVAEWVADSSRLDARYFQARGGSYKAPASALSAAAEAFVERRGDAAVGFRLVRERVFFKFKGTVVVAGKTPRPVLQFRLVDANGWKFAPDASPGTGRFQSTGPFEAPRPMNPSDADFTIQLPEGEYRAEVSGLPRGYTAQSVAAGSTNLLQTALRVTGSKGVPRITIALVAAPSLHPWISGYVVAPASGKPDRAVIRIGFINSAYAEPFETSVDRNGRFATSLPPGSYQVFFPGRAPMVSGPRAQIGGRAIEVQDSDIRDLVIHGPLEGCIYCSGVEAVSSNPPSR